MPWPCLSAPLLKRSMQCWTPLARQPRRKRRQRQPPRIGTAHLSAPEPASKGVVNGGNLAQELPRGDELHSQTSRHHRSTLETSDTLDTLSTSWPPSSWLRRGAALGPPCLPPRWPGDAPAQAAGAADASDVADMSNAADVSGTCVRASGTCAGMSFGARHCGAPRCAAVHDEKAHRPPKSGSAAVAPVFAGVPSRPRRQSRKGTDGTKIYQAAPQT